MEVLGKVILLLLLTLVGLPALAIAVSFICVCAICLAMVVLWWKTAKAVFENDICIQRGRAVWTREK